MNFKEKLTEATMQALQGKSLNENISNELDIVEIEDAILKATQEILDQRGIDYKKYTNPEMMNAVKFDFDGSTFVISVNEMDMIDTQDLDESKNLKTESRYALKEESTDKNVEDEFDEDLKYELEKRYDEYKFKNNDMPFDMWLDEFGDKETEEIRDEFFNNLDESKNIKTESEDLSYTVITEGIQDDRLQSTINQFKDLGYEVYKEGDKYKALLKNDAEPVLAMFYGKSAKPRFHYRFHSMKELDDYLDKYLNNKQEIEQGDAERRAQRKITADHNIKVGDIFYTYWGYDQTNSEFYEVVAVRGSRIDLRELDYTVDSSGESWGENKIYPNPGHYVSDDIHTVSARADGTVTNLDGESFLHLSKWEGKPISVTASGWGH